MRIETKLRLLILSVGVPLVAGLSYWVVSENVHPVAHKALADAEAPARDSAPASPRPSVPAASLASRASALPNGASPTMSPSESTAAAVTSLAILPIPNEPAMTEADRRLVQDALHRLGYYEGSIEANFGPSARAAIRHFQQDIRAKVTGRLTAEEANRLARWRVDSGSAPQEGAR